MMHMTHHRDDHLFDGPECLSKAAKREHTTTKNKCIYIYIYIYIYRVLVSKSPWNGLLDDTLEPSRFYVCAHLEMRALGNERQQVWDGSGESASQ